MSRFIKRFVPIAVGYYIATDLIRWLQTAARHNKTSSGTVHRNLALQDSLRYIEEVFSDYKVYGGISRFTGRVAEIGPGDSAGVALLILRDGADHVDLVDRYYSARSNVQQHTIYRALADKFPELKRYVPERVGVALKEITWHTGPAAAAEVFFDKPGVYQFIVSRAVFEHLYDPFTALRGMCNGLAAGGTLLHKVDLSDHGLLSTQNNELRFLEIPEFVYGAMTRHSGRPNRVLVHEYRACLSALGLNSSLLVTRLASVGPVIPHLPYTEIPDWMRTKAADYVRSVRHRFASCFQDVSNEDLSVTGIFIIARKERALGRSANCE